MGLKNIATSLGGLDKCEMLARQELVPIHTTWSRRKDQKNKWDIFLSRRGVLHVINKYRKPTPNLINLTKCLGIDLHKNKWLCKEQDTLRQIMQAFKGEEMIHQFSVGKYRIYLCFPGYKLAIECDKFDHRDRDVAYEIE